MPPKIKKTAFVTLFFLCLFQLANAQQLKQGVIDKLKNGYTHIVVDTADFKDADEFLKVFRENWPYSKGVSYLNRSQFKDNLVDGDTYFSLELDLTSPGNGYLGTPSHNYIAIF